MPTTTKERFTVWCWNFSSGKKRGIIGRTNSETIAYNIADEYLSKFVKTRVIDNWAHKIVYEPDYCVV